MCTKANQENPRGGLIEFWAGQVVDSAIESNTQYDTDGIRLGLGYTEQDQVLGYAAAVSPDMAVEIRHNSVIGEYDYPSSCSWSGISIWTGAGQTSGSSPPRLTSDVSIAHNTVTQADGLNGGGIDFTLSWVGGPSPGPWNLADGVAVFANQLNNISGPASTVVSGPLPYASSQYENAGCKSGTGAAPRRGISFADSSTWNTLLLGNSCENITKNVFDAGLGTTGTQQICSAATVDGCECPVSPAAYWRFDEGSGLTSADDSGGSNNATLIGGPMWTSGESGNALNFAAAASYAAISNTSALDDLYNSGHGMTVTAWINPASAGGGGAGRIIDKDNNLRGWFLKMNNTGTSVQFAADQFATAAIRNSVTGSISLNQWQHVAVTWDGSPDATKINIYINGVLANDSASPTNGSGSAQSDTGTPFTIGNRTLDKARNFDGSIDGVRVYNRMLSPAEIQSLVNGGS